MRGDPLEADSCLLAGVKLKILSVYMTDTLSSEPKIAISAEEQERRREVLRQADASNCIEELFPDPAATAIFEDLFVVRLKFTTFALD
jgi:hypothetical protein